MIKLTKYFLVLITILVISGIFAQAKATNYDIVSCITNESDLITMENQINGFNLTINKLLKETNGLKQQKDQNVLLQQQINKNEKQLEKLISKLKKKQRSLELFNSKMNQCFQEFNI